jgi:S-adenosylmethionine hydrolase
MGMLVFVNPFSCSEEILKFITLLTDFGIRDGNVGVMKWVIWGIAPDAQIADISHTIEPQNILTGAIVLGRSTPYFPPGSIHMAVVDPGVGTERRPIAAYLADRYFVGPDNGLFTVMLEKAERAGVQVKVVHLDQSNYWLEKVSHVFHGRDIFAPVAAHLANGLPLELLGSPVFDPVRLVIPKPVSKNGVCHGEILHIDHFGNVVSNITAEDLSGWNDDRTKVNIIFKKTSISGLVYTFGEKNLGELIALFGSTGNLILSVVNGDAARQTGARLHDAIEVKYSMS